MLLLITDTGRVQNSIVLIPEDVDDVQLDNAADMLNRIVDGQLLEEASAVLEAQRDRLPLELRGALDRVVTALQDDARARDSERVFLEGTSNIVDEAKFEDLETVRQIIGALEHRRVMLEVLADALSVSSVSVTIGSENPIEEMQHCSVIAAPYGGEGRPLGSLGVVGPTRMNYGRTIAAVHEVAFALGRMLRELGI